MLIRCVLSLIMVLNSTSVENALSRKLFERNVFTQTVETTSELPVIEQLSGQNLGNDFDHFILAMGRQIAPRSQFNIEVFRGVVHGV